MNLIISANKQRWLAIAMLGIALVAIIACGKETVTVVETVIVTEKGDTVVETVIVTEKGDTIIEKGDTVVQTVIVEKEVKGDTVTIVQTAVPQTGSPQGLPVQQGTLRVSVPQVGSPVFLNEKAVFPTNMLQFYFGIQETLLTGDKNSCSVPQLATAWELASDLSKVTFSIRPGVHFYTDDRDLGEMTAEDVVFSYNSSGADNPSSVHSAAGELNSIFNPWVINPTNPSKVDAPFKQFQGDYLTANTVSECNDSAAVVSKALFDELGPDETLITPHGTGPFIVTDWKSNEKITFRANNDYWKTPAFVSNLELIESPEGAIRTAQLRTGEVDIAPVPISDVPSLESNGFLFDDGLRQFQGNFIYFSGNYYMDTIPENGESVTRDSFKPDADHPWVGDPNDAARDESAKKVRHALSMAIDRELINDTILAGFGGPIYGGHGQVPIHQNHPEFNDRWIIPFDADAAKTLLAEAGYPDGFSVSDYFCPVDIGVNGEVCQAVAGMWSEFLNIDVQLDTSAYTARRPTMVGRTINTIWQTTWGPNRLAYDGESGGTDGCCLFPQPTGGYNPGLEHQVYYDTFIATGASVKGSSENLAAREEYFDWAFEQRFSAGVVEVPTLIGINPDRVISWTLQPFRDINSFHTVILATE